MRGIFLNFRSYNELELKFKTFTFPGHRVNIRYVVLNT